MMFFIHIISQLTATEARETDIKKVDTKQSREEKRREELN